LFFLINFDSNKLSVKLNKIHILPLSVDHLQSLQDGENFKLGAVLLTKRALTNIRGLIGNILSFIFIFNLK